MRYGGSHWLEEAARNQRRVSLLTFASSLFVAALLALCGLPAIRERLWKPESFGFEGALQYVQRMRLETIAAEDVPGNSALTLIESRSRKGGGDETRPSPTRADAVQPRRADHAMRGLGEQSFDLDARLRALQLDAPVFRSEELVVVRAVNPIYPEEAIAADAEGPVLVLMEVDTTGAVTSVRLIGESPHPSLEQAVVDAALQYRYRPYVSHGTKQRVYAAYRFTFRLQ